jgi:hypothetical protein
MKLLGRILVAIVVLILGLGVGRLSAGSPDAPGGPNSPAAQMFTLEQIYQQLVSGTVTSPMTAFTEPTTPPGVGTMHTLNEIMARAPAPDNTNGVTSNRVLSGTTFWGLNVAAGQWGVMTGTLPAGQSFQGPEGQRTISIPDGVYFTPILSNVLVLPKTATAVDSDLKPENVKLGVTIFDITGSQPPAGVAKTGQTQCYDASGAVISCAFIPEDGAQQRGVTTPIPRFVVEGSGPLEGPGTVTDRLTGLIWARNANCFGAVTWAQAINLVIQVNNGLCGIPFNQLPGADWRLPNIRELFTLADFGNSPAFPPGMPFTNVPAANASGIRYWSNTSLVIDATRAWNIDFVVGTVNRNQPKTDTYYVWPVRGGS